MTESNGPAPEQTSKRHVIPEKQRSRSMHQLHEGSDRSPQHVDVPGLMAAMQPFLVMVCEEIAKALVKVSATQGIRATLAAASSQAHSPVVSNCEEARHGPVGEEGQLSANPDKTTHGYHLADAGDVESVNIVFASEEESDEGDALNVQPLFDPKLPPTADSELKPKVGLVSMPGSDFEGLRQRYPQLHLTILPAEGLSDVRRFGHCQRIIALREEISAGTDALLSRLLRHRYIRLDGGMNGVIMQLDAWLASPGSIVAGSRRRVPFSGMERNAASERKPQNRYPKRISDAG